MVDKQVSVRLKAEGGGQLKAEFRDIGNEAERSFGQIDRGARMGGQGLQNVGFQVQDFAVQVAGGTDASRALAQQLPQLLSGFGLLGVLLGTTAAVAIPIFNAFGVGADKAEELSASVTALTAAMREYESASRAAAASPTDLFGDFGSGAAQAQEVLNIQRQIAAARAQNALAQASGAIGGVLRDPQALEETLQRIREIEAEIARAQSDPNLLATFNFDRARQQLEFEKEYLTTIFDDIAYQLGVSLDGAEAEVEALAQSLSVLRDASGAEATAAALADVREKLIAAAEAGGEMSDEALTLLQSLTDAELAALGLSRVYLASSIGAGADEAARLADNLFRASRLEYGKIQNTGQSGPDAARRSVMYLNAPGVLTGTVAGGAGGVFVPPRGRAGGGGGGGGGVSQAEREAARIYDQTRTAAEKYKIELAELNALHKAGHLDTETYTRAVEKLGKDLDKTSDLGKKAADAIRGAFDNLDDGDAAALRNLAAELAKMALYAGLARVFPGVFGSGGLVPLANANGNAFDGGVVQPFATGGIVSSATMFPMRGGMGVMGEAGPEAIMPLARVGGKLGVVAAGGGAPPVQVNVINNSGAPVATTEKRGANGQRTVDVMVGESIGGGRQDRVLASRFGTRPNVVKR